VPTLATPPALASAAETALGAAIDRDWLPGGVVLVQQRGVRLLLSAYGLSRKYSSRSSLATDQTPATPLTLYDLASITKLFTTTCVMRLVEAGRCGLDEPVAHTLPAFAAGGKETVTLRQLLTHTSGLPADVPLWQLDASPAERLQQALQTPLQDPPGTTYRYSDVGLIAVGQLIEQVTGSPLDRAIHDQVSAPLGLQDTLFRPPASLQPRIAPTEDEQQFGRGMVWGEVHDENAWALGGVAGHAGLFSTAADLAALAQLYLDGGPPLLHPDTVAEMTRNQIGRLGERGLGWELNQSYYMGHLASPTTYGHTGFTGTSLVIDPRQELIVVLLSNRVHPTRDSPSINPTRQAVANAALAAQGSG
jgi:CubicO group peptidase (beta-lactamase class C family)